MTKIDYGFKMGWVLVDKKTGSFTPTTIYRTREAARQEQHKPTELVKQVRIQVWN